MPLCFESTFVTGSAKELMFEDSRVVLCWSFAASPYVFGAAQWRRARWLRAAVCFVSAGLALQMCFPNVCVVGSCEPASTRQRGMQLHVVVFSDRSFTAVKVIFHMIIEIPPTLGLLRLPRYSSSTSCSAVLHSWTVNMLSVSFRWLWINTERKKW